MSAPALELRDIHKRFGETVALDGARCVVRPGTVHALLGENGAGKTTLMRIAFGLESADDGRIAIRGADPAPHSSGRALALGLGMVHQHFELIPAFTVAENVALGGRGLLDAAQAAQRVRAVGDATGLPLDPHARVATLPVSAQQRTELVRALARDASLLILDEPTAVLTPDEAAALYRWMRTFADRGGSVVLITHKLREALAVADDVTVLRRGRTVLEASRADCTEASLVDAIVGAGSVPERTPPLPPSGGPVVLALDRVWWRGADGRARVREATLEVRAGEILGVLGVEGAGQRELLRLLAGRLEASAGTVRRPVHVGFVPEDRLADAVVPSLSLTENFALAGLADRRGRMPWSMLAAETGRALVEDDVRAAGPAARCATLSGGNQQKFVVARERRFATTAFVAENPTRGLDVRASATVLAALRQAAADGAAVVVSSSDLDEVLALTRRVVVCFAGAVTEVDSPADPTDRTPYARALLGLPA